MRNEIALDLEGIIIQQGTVIFSQYEILKNQALELADHIRSVKVDNENIKQSKKLLAEVNKRCNELDQKRITIKKVMLEPVQIFEEQVKEVIGIVKEADDLVRQQVKQLEEEERQAKHNVLEDLFHKRLVHYSFRDLFSFADFLKPKHLNKTITIDAVEKEMVQFFDQLCKDLKAIETMPNAENVLSLYLEVKDLAAALTIAEQQEQRRRKIEASEAIKKQPIESEIAYLVSVKVYNQKELKLLELLLQENEFEFITDKITGGF